jgi:putative membrane protein
MTVHRLAMIGGAVLLALALSAAAALGQTSGAPTSSSSYLAPTDSISGQSMLEILAQANRDEIRQAQGTLGSTRDPAIRAFAEQMISAHTAALARVNTLWDRLGYTRADSTTTLTGTVADSVRGLGAGVYPGTAADASADRGYVSGQVTAHQALLTQLQQKAKLVSEPQVRALAVELQAAVTQHLADAKALDGRLARTTP